MDVRIINILNFIEDNLHLSLTLSELSAKASLSTSQFHRIFKKDTGKTPFAFIEALKMKKAYHLLTNEKTLVQQLANNLGYNDYETFSRAFKKHFYCAPDDLKAITNGLRQNFITDEVETFIVATVDQLSEEEMEHRLQHLIQEHGLTKEQLSNATIFKIVEKSAMPPNGILIKNKYQVETNSGEKLWQSILNSSHTTQE